ncbi:MAG: carboxypeptidase regulatory-like domain-containing protein [bacterium]|nr:carboxypeptidase regulatory-like domain-containing protein [bacterium]
MTHNKSTSLLVVLVLLVGGGAALQWFLGGLDDGASEESDAVGMAPEEGPPIEAVAPTGEPDGIARTDLVPSTQATPTVADSETTVAYPLLVEVSLVRRGTFTPVEGVPALGSGANARIRGSVLAPNGSGLAATITFEHGPNAGRVLTCDSSGAFGASDLHQGYSVVRIEARGVGMSEREVLLRQLSETPLNVTFGRPASVAGIVKDRKGEPIVGATVRLDGGESTTDDEGTFYFPQVTAGAVLAVVKKPGYTMYRETVHLEAGGAIQRDRMTFTLLPAASLDVSIQERLGTGPAQLYMFPAGGQPANTGVGQRSFPWHEVNPTSIPPGGSVSIDGLPDTSVTLVLFQAGAEAHPRMVNQRLYSGRKSSVVLHLKPSPVVRGVVKGTDGKPVSRARVQLEAPHRSLATTKILQKRPTFNMEMILPHLPSALQEVQTDSRGRFALTAYDVLRDGVYLSAETQDGTQRGTLVVTSGAKEVELRLQPVSAEQGGLELKMAGRFQGLPVHVRINGTPDDPVVLPAGTELSLEELEAGTWRLDARWRGRYLVQNQLFDVAAGKRSELALVLPRGALEGQTEDERRRAGKK